MLSTCKNEGRGGGSNTESLDKIIENFNHERNKNKDLL